MWTPSPVKDDAADQLHPEGTHPQHPEGGLPADGKGLGEQIVQLFPVCQPRPEFGGLGLELGVGEGLVGLLQRLDLFHQGLQGLDLFLRGGAKDFS